MNDAISLDNGDKEEGTDDLADIIHSPTRTPEEEIIRQQKIQTLREVVDKLKPHYRRLIELRYYEEFSYEEISQQLDIPVGTIKAQLFRAREFLYHILKNTQGHFHED
jgi:RNA polymerase sigma-70 factor (ECF subfamily)